MTHVIMINHRLPYFDFTEFIFGLIQVSLVKFSPFTEKSPKVRSFAQENDLTSHNWQN